MLGKLLSCCFAFVAGASSLMAAGSSTPSASFKVDEVTGIPGTTLAPGSYSIRVVDHLSDRYVLRVEGPSGKNEALFIGIPRRTLARDVQGEIKWTAPVNGTAYVRGWNFPSLTTALEFAYPKNDAVALAKANNAQVPAIDPESDGMVAATHLSDDQMHMITLWLLSPTEVGPNAPAGIQAARLQQVASVQRKPSVAKLPHTATALPWLWLIGMFALVSGAGLRLARVAR